MFLDYEENDKEMRDVLRDQLLRGFKETITLTKNCQCGLKEEGVTDASP